jgi:hypothetical protein
MLLAEQLVGAAAHVLTCARAPVLPASGLSSSLLRFLMSASRLLPLLPGPACLCSALPAPGLTPERGAGEAARGEGKLESTVEDLVNVPREEQVGDASSLYCGLAMLF